MFQAEENAFRYALIAEHCIRLQQGQPDLDRLRIPFLKLAETLAGTSSSRVWYGAPHSSAIKRYNYTVPV